jgi:hypothetical protein
MGIFDGINEQMQATFGLQKEKDPAQLPPANLTDFNDLIQSVYGEFAFDILLESGSIEELVETGSATVNVAGRSFVLSLSAAEVANG